MRINHQPLESAVYQSIYQPTADTRPDIVRNQNRISKSPYVGYNLPNSGPMLGSFIHQSNNTLTYSIQQPQMVTSVINSIPTLQQSIPQTPPQPLPIQQPSLTQSLPRQVPLTSIIRSAPQQNTIIQSLETNKSMQSSNRNIEGQKTLIMQLATDNIIPTQRTLTPMPVAPQWSLDGPCDQGVLGYVREVPIAARVKFS